MEKLIIKGTNRLTGEVSVHGAKNGALPILAASLLIKGESIIHNCPNLSDVRASIKILEHLGCICSRSGNTVTVNSQNVNCSEIPEKLMREMRSSIVFLGAIIARCSSAKLSSPGGCEIGARPIDLHLSSLKQLGAEVEESHGCIICNTCGLKGSNIYIPIASVGTTENIIIAAATASGTTRIFNAAREPEISDLAAYLNSAGAKIYGAGSSDIVIEGVSALHSTEHSVIPDRILTGTYMSAIAITGGSGVIKGICPEHIKAITAEYQQMGCEIYINNNELKLTAPDNLKRIKLLKTQYYPGFPTDAGPTLIATATKAAGTSIFVETIFENRFKFAGELNRLGADIKVEGRTAVVEGGKALTGARVKCTDLRGGAALMVAALNSGGITEIEEIQHIDRGYEKPQENLALLGADIKRVRE